MQASEGGERAAAYQARFGAPIGRPRAPGGAGRARRRDVGPPPWSCAARLAFRARPGA